MKIEIIEYLNKIIEQLKITDERKLDKIYLEINSDDNLTRINLGNLQTDNKHEMPNDYLLITMDESTFYDLKDNKKHPEDLMFEEKIKIKGNLELLK